MATRMQLGECAETVMTLELEKLVAELKAIECWDAFYYRYETGDRPASSAFNSRQERRREIIELIRAASG